MSSVKKNYIYNVMYQMLVMILPIITAPYISRILGAEGTGIYSYTYSVANYFVLFAMLGLNNYGNRIIAKVRDNKDKLSIEFKSVYTIQFILAFIISILYLLYSCFFVNTNKEIAYIQGLYVLSAILDINWFFWGMEKFKLTVTRNTVIKFISVALIFIFVKKPTDLWKYTLIMSISILISQLAIWPFVRKYVNLKEKISIKNAFKKHLRPMLVLFIPVIATSVYRIMDKIMLGKMISMEVVGQYEYADKIVNMTIALFTSLGTVMLPKISNLISKGENDKSKEYLDKSMEFSMFIGLPISVGIISVADNFMPLFLGTEYVLAGRILQCLSISLIFIIIGNNIKTQYLIPNERDKEFIVSVILGAIVNFVLNIVLIPKLNVFGAVIGTISAEIVVCAYQILSVKNEIDNRLYIKMFFKYLSYSIIMFVCINTIRIFIKNEIYLMILQIISGIIIYSILSRKYIKTILKSVVK